MKPCTVARSTVRGSWEWPSLSERATREAPRCIRYTNNPGVPKVAIGVRIHQWPWHNEGCIYKYNQGAFTVALFLTNFWNFLRISNRQNQSVVNAFQYVLSPTRHILWGWRREWRVRRYNLILNYETMSPEKAVFCADLFLASLTYSVQFGFSRCKNAPVMTCLGYFCGSIC